MKDISYGKEDDLNLKLIIGLSRSVLTIKKHDGDLFRRHGLTMAQFGVLEILYHKGDMRVCQIIEKTLSTGGNMTVVINNLQKEGLIHRRRDPEDNRAYIICLTPKGRQLIDEIFPEHLKNIQTYMNHLTIEEKEKLSHLLKRLNHLA